jgi:hypothetical protein
MADRATVRAVLDLFAVDGSDFYHNEANDYGVIDLKLFLGPGNPWHLYRGEEVQADFIDGRRGTGSYRLNDALVDEIMRRLP